MAEKFSFDSALAELENIIQQMESGTTGLDELEINVKKGVDLIKKCKEKLRSTESSVKNIIKDLDDKSSGTNEID